MHTSTFAHGLSSFCPVSTPSRSRASSNHAGAVLRREVREFRAIAAKGGGARFIPKEFELATSLMDELFSPEFAPSPTAMNIARRR
jgi:hypothetical protein